MLSIQSVLCCFCRQLLEKVSTARDCGNPIYHCRLKSNLASGFPYFTKLDFCIYSSSYYIKNIKTANSKNFWTLECYHGIIFFQCTLKLKPLSARIGQYLHVYQIIIWYDNCNFLKIQPTAKVTKSVLC